MNQAWDYLPAPFNGPFDMVARLINGVAAASLPVEGLWTQAGWAKAQSLEVSGSMSTLALAIYGSNAPAPPLNTYTVTVGGSATQGDTLTLTFSNGNLGGGSRAVAYAVGASPSLNGIAAALAAAISADPVLSPYGFIASAAGAVITITFPSVPPGSQTPSPTQPPPSNITTIAASAGGGTETFTIASGANGTLLTNITTLGFIALPTLPRWITGRLTTLTGTNATITADWHGAA